MEKLNSVTKKNTLESLTTSVKKYINNPHNSFSKVKATNNNFSFSFTSYTFVYFVPFCSINFLNLIQDEGNLSPIKYIIPLSKSIKFKKKNLC